MIWRLAREQLRSQWRYTAWSAGLLAFALALATYAMVTGATVIKFQRDFGTYVPQEYYVTFESVFGSGNASVVNPSDVRLPFDEVQALVAQASDEVTVTASVMGAGRIDGIPNEGIVMMATTPSIDWGRFLVAGDPPELGEIAISIDLAHRLKIDVGDSITLNAYGAEEAPKQSTTVVIAGLVRSRNVEPYWAGDERLAYVPWSNVRDFAIAFPSWREIDASTGDVVSVVHTGVGWTGDSGTLAPFAVATPHREPFYSSADLRNAWSNTDQRGYWALSTAGLTVLAMVIAAFGMGRAQAEARTKWAATTRVLGATRGTVALASVIETAIVSIAGIAIGAAIGVAAVGVNLSVLRSTHPDALLPAGPNAPLSLLLAAGGIGLTIALVIAAIPAFWSARVALAAALKPVTPVGEARLSRDVSRWWLPGVFGGAAVAWCGLYAGYDSRSSHGFDDNVPMLLAMTLVAIVLAVAGFALVLEGSRLIVARIGSLLSWSRRPWLIAAGDGLAAHRGVYTFAAIAPLLTSGIATWVVTSNAAFAYVPIYGSDGQFVDVARGADPMPGFSTWWHDQLNPGGVAAAMMLFGGVVTVVAAVVTLSSRRLFASDAATRSALGLGSSGERVAVAVRQWVVMGSGTVVGALLVWLAHIVTLLGADVLSSARPGHPFGWYVTVAGYGAAGAGLVVGNLLAVTLAGSLAVGLLTRSGTPVDALRRAAG